MYLQCSAIKDVTGMGVTEHVVETLEAFGLDGTYQRNNLSGCAMDGQYIHLKFSEHLSNILLKDYHMTWDPAHRIELSIKDSNSNDDRKQSFIETTGDTIQARMKLLSIGKSYMEFLEAAHLSDQFLTPKIFKSIKFVGHCSSFLQSFSCNFNAIISSLEKMNTLETLALQESILNLDFILDYLMMSDIMSHLSYCSKSVQRGCSFP